MVSLETRRKTIQWSIAQNPTPITIQRTEYERTNRGATERKSTVGSFVVRLYRTRQGLPQERLTTGGTTWTNESWGLLADYTADIRSGPDVRDEFEVPGIGKFFIRAVYPHIINGEIAGYQAELEQIG